MKKYIILSILIGCFLTTYSQDLIKELQKLTLVNDSLKKELKLEKENSTKKLQATNDSINRLITANKTEVLNLKSKIGKLEKDTANLNKQIKKLDKNNIKRIEAQLQQKTDSINLLNEKIKKKNEEFISSKNESVKKEQEKYNEGQQKVFNQIAQMYQKNDIDYLIKCSTHQSVERDLQMVGNNAEAKKKLQDLQIFFNAQQVLEEKYSDLKVKIVQGQISSITQEGLIKNITERISKYKLCNDGLKTTINKIIELDKKFVANDDDTQKTKLQDILFELSWYFRNYRFNFADYPYLSNIVLEIMKLKQKDANTDISDLFLKL